jgi:hypothetical protein
MALGPDGKLALLSHRRRMVLLTRKGNRDPRFGRGGSLSEVRQVRNRVRANGRKFYAALSDPEKVSEGKSKDIWVTEVGWPVNPEIRDPGHPAVSPPVQAELLDATFNMLKAKSQEKVSRTGGKIGGAMLRK